MHNSLFIKNMFVTLLSSTCCFVKDSLKIIYKANYFKTFYLSWDTEGSEKIHRQYMMQATFTINLKDGIRKYGVLGTLK